MKTTAHCKSKRVWSDIVHGDNNQSFRKFKAFQKTDKTIVFQKKKNDGLLSRFSVFLWKFQVLATTHQFAKQDANSGLQSKPPLNV